jgi:hypothetical protein
MRCGCGAKIHSNSISFFWVQMDSGSQIFRFSFKCYRCSAEITFKSDPQSSYYTVESGASRHVEPWCEEDEVSDIGRILLGFIKFYVD